VPFSCSCAYFSRIFIDSKGFVGGWSYWFARSVGLAVQLVAIQNVIAFWDPNLNLSPLWISLFLLALFLFNLMHVRNLGEIEYWLALIKLQGILALSVFGILMSMGVSPGTRQSGTSSDNSTVISCSQAQTQGGQCLDPNVPGFECNISSLLSRLTCRLDGGCISILLL
jgi:amino acid permease